MKLTALGIIAASVIASAQAKPVEQVDTVAVAGCLKEAPAGSWTLAAASEPVTSTANAPSPKELAELPKSGKAEFRLIGVGIFNLPSHRNHAVVVKGLLVKAAPISRINVTSVTMVSETCPPKQ
jgi:hypothetical protein